jgi:predicted ATPase
MQLAVLFRLAVDAGTAVSYRAISEDIWGMDAPGNTRAALQSIVSRLRSQLPPGAIESTVGGYRLRIARSEVDALVFTDLIAAASVGGPDAVRLASEALALWAGEPWIPSENFDWFIRDLGQDRERALELGGTMAAVCAHIPAPLTRLVGREAELATIADQLETSRLVTIIGTGGAGKTRLALAGASRSAGSVLVELAPVGPGEVLGAVLAATGREIRTVEGGSEAVGTRDRVLEALIGREILLVLDNCEHVIDAAASLAEDLLSTLPQLRILATSREPLGIPGEAFVGVGSLPHPVDAQIDSLAPSELGGFAAIELFCQRATAARGVELRGEEVVTAARVCARLDGLPLAIELAAARLRTMSVDEVLAGLEDRFTLLTGGYRTALPRHQTLRAMIDWSWSLLDEDERLALARFAVFPAGVGAMDAGELAIALGLLSASVFDALVDRSLLQRVRGRYRALETIREYGIERLSENGTLAEAREAQTRYMAARTAVVDRLLRGPRIIEAIEWFDAEDDNIASALRYVTSVPLPDVAVALAVSCAWYWLVRDRNDDARIWFTAVAPLASEAAGDEARILALVYPLAKGFAERANEFEPGRAAPEVGELLKPLEEIRIGAGSHEFLQLLGPALSAFGAVIGQRDWMLRVRLPDGNKLNLDPWPTAVLHIGRSAMAHNRGEIQELGEASELALSLFTDLGDLWGLALAQQMRAEWLTLHGQLEEALELSDASTASMKMITSSLDLAQQQGLGIRLLVRLGRRDEARARVTAMLQDAEAGANFRTVVLAQLIAVSLDVSDGDLASAASRLTIIDDLIGLWHEMPGQLRAMVEATRASVARASGDLDLAESHLRIAAEHGIRSLDHPVIGGVAVAFGTLSLDRGDLQNAVRAINVASGLIGAYDATDPEVVAIADAAEKAGIERPGTRVSDRPMAIESLKQLLEA